VDARIRRGIVFIAWADNDDEPGFYWGYWDGGGHGSGDGFLEQMPETPSTRVAVDWARARSDRVKIRPRWDPAQYYSAGDFTYPNMPPLRDPEVDE
jgi:hypothetical protein